MSRAPTSAQRQPAAFEQPRIRDPEDPRDPVALDLQHHQAVWLVDGRHKVVNGLGEFFFEIDADRESGVIDMLAGPREEALQLFPTRVVPLAEGGSAFTFTMFQAPGQPDEQFEDQYQSLLREFKNLELLFG